MQDPWTIYWQSGCLDSCVATQSSQDAVAIEAFWQGLATQLESGSRILDLATGNGTVPAALLRVDNTLRVTGVDKAKIEPLRFLSERGELASADFHGNVDVCSLPFDDAEFDAVTSQFGIEYASLPKAVPEAVRVVRRGGKLQLLMHHADSEVVKPARAKRREMGSLLAEGGVLQKLKAYVAGQLTEDELESSGQAHFASGGRSSQITGQIFEGVYRIISSVNSGDIRAARELCDVMLLRLSADRDRLGQLEDAALSQSQMDSLVSLLETAGIRTVTARALCANEGAGDEFIIGWQYRGEKD